MVRSAFAARVAAATCLAQIAVSPSLWFPDGWLVPISVVGVPLAALSGLTVVLILVGALLVLNIRPEVTVPAFAVVILLRAGLDRALWQTYVLEQFTIAALIAIHARRSGEVDDAVVPIRWLLALTYAWAGLHKINPTFIENGLGLLVGEAVNARWTNLALALGEFVLGVALLVPRVRYVAAWMLSGVSIGIAGAVLATGLNRAVIPWNLAHAVLLPVLFRTSEHSLFRDELRRKLVGIVALVFGVLPAAYPLGWPPYLALRLYTANSLGAIVFVDDLESLPTPARRVALTDDSGTFAASIDLQRWAHEATGAFLPPEPATFKTIAARMCDRSEVLLILRPAPEWWERSPPTRYLRCEDL